jgi:transcriptional regulator GlxA family with amidase domain
VDSNIWTGSGSAAGIDMALAWVGQVYGHSVAQHLSNLLEFNRAQNSTDDPFAELWKAGA